mmetsp:Transcript_44064/g.121979  ORF Transcript_44064/g.121979 Transcript_44064/m.121979 type:complete len:228 (-) Transcript_44064:498-1181(-)
MVLPMSERQNAKRAPVPPARLVVGTTALLELRECIHLETGYRMPRWVHFDVLLDEAPAVPFGSMEVSCRHRSGVRCRMASQNRKVSSVQPPAAKLARLLQEAQLSLGILLRSGRCDEVPCTLEILLSLGAWRRCCQGTAALCAIRRQVLAYSAASRALDAGNQLGVKGSTTAAGAECTRAVKSVGLPKLCLSLPRWEGEVDIRMRELLTLCNADHGPNNLHRRLPFS